MQLKFNGPWVSDDDGLPSQLSIHVNEQGVTVPIAPPFHGQVTVNIILMQNYINVGMGFVFPFPLNIYRPTPGHETKVSSFYFNMH